MPLDSDNASLVATALAAPQEKWQTILVMWSNNAFDRTRVTLGLHGSGSSCAERSMRALGT